LTDNLNFFKLSQKSARQYASSEQEKEKVPA